MDLGTIPTENVVLISAMLSAYIAYQSRINGLETDRERERYLNFRLQDSTHFSDMWAITIDNILIHEKSGLFYRLRKFLTGSLSGEASVVVRYEKRSIPGSFWETDAGEAILDSYGVEVEHLGTEEHLDPTVARFKFGSVDYEDIAGFFDAVLELEKEMRPTPDED